MKQHRARAWGVLTLLLWLGGCATVSDPSRVQRLLDYNRLDYNSDRGTTFLSRASADAPVMICVEPSLDVALMFTRRILAEGRIQTAGVNAWAESDVRMVDLANRTQTVLMSMRQALAQLCEQWGKKKLPPRERIKGYELALDAGMELAELTTSGLPR